MPAWRRFSYYPRKVESKRTDGRSQVTVIAARPARELIYSDKVDDTFPLVRALRMLEDGLWSNLKYQTQYWPEFAEFPYFPAAVEFQDSVGAAGKTAPARSFETSISSQKHRGLKPQAKTRGYGARSCGAASWTAEFS
jgi:hypothetical protein